MKLMHALSLLTDINSTQKNQQVKYPGKDPTVQQGPLLLQELSNFHCETCISGE